MKIVPLNYDNAILVLKFDDTNFDYSNALFESISNALEQMPSANFEVVAVSPTGGASFSDKASQRASDVFSKIIEMGVPSERVLSHHQQHLFAQAEEVHIYLKNIKSTQEITPSLQFFVIFKLSINLTFRNCYRYENSLNVGFESFEI